MVTLLYTSHTVYTANALTIPNSTVMAPGALVCILCAMDMVCGGESRGKALGKNDRARRHTKSSEGSERR